jgi:hypothetical protein
MHPRRRIAALLLGLGTVAGFASGAHSLSCHRAERASFEQHVADVCVEAAARARDQARPVPRAARDDARERE